jgi:hypothetical protein
LPKSIEKDLRLIPRGLKKLINAKSVAPGFLKVRPFALIVEINLVEEERYMFYPECGKTNDEDSKFCQNCGAVFSGNRGGFIPRSRKKLVPILAA